jgi:hypothetical protein
MDWAGLGPAPVVAAAVGIADKAAAPTLAHPLVASEATSIVVVTTARILPVRMGRQGTFCDMVILQFAKIALPNAASATEATFPGCSTGPNETALNRPEEKIKQLK